MLKIFPEIESGIRLVVWTLIVMQMSCVGRWLACFKSSTELHVPWVAK